MFYGIYKIINLVVLISLLFLFVLVLVVFELIEREFVFDGLLDESEETLVVLGYHGDDLSLLSESACSAESVDHLCDIIGDVEVDYCAGFVYVESPLEYVSGNENSLEASFEEVKIFKVFRVVLESADFVCVY